MWRSDSTRRRWTGTALHDTPSAFVEQSAYLEDEFASAEIKSGKQRVRCLLIVIVSVLAPLRVGGLRPLGIAHRPSCDSEFMDTLIADISVAGVPKPMPVVLEP